MSSSSSFCNNNISKPKLLLLLLSITTSSVQFNHVSARLTPGSYAHHALTPTANLSDTALVSYEKEMQEVAEVISPSSIQGAKHDVSNHMCNDSNTSTNFNKNMSWLFIIIMLLTGAGLSVHIYCHFCQPASSATNSVPATVPAHGPVHDIELNLDSQPAAIPN